MILQSFRNYLLFGKDYRDSFKFYTLDQCHGKASCLVDFRKL